MTKLSAIAAAGSAPASSTQFVAVTGGTTDNLYTLSQIASTIPTPLIATSNMTWYVATTGSDSNPGTSGSPFLTIQHALNVAASYDWANQYIPTISIANGTYNQQLILPFLKNCPIGGLLEGNLTTPANVVISDTGTGFAILTAVYATWYVWGIQTTGTYGAFSFGYYSTTFLYNINIAGSLSQEIFLQGNLSTVVCGLNGTTLGTSINISATSALGLLFSRGSFIADDTTITFANAITFSSFVISLDATLAFMAFYSANFVNPTNVTCNGTYALLINNGAYFEGNSTSLSGGVALTRVNFPGTTVNGQDIDGWSTFGPDSSSIKQTAGTVSFTDTNGVLRADYNHSNASAWTFKPANGALAIQGSVGFDPSFQLDDTPNGGTDWGFVNTSNAFGAVNFSSGSFQEPFAVLNSAFNLSNIPLTWNSGTQAAPTGAASDTGIARNAAGVVEVNNATAGTFRDLYVRDLYTHDASFAMRSKTTITGGGTSNTPTLTTGPVTGNPTKWLPYDDNGTTRYIPAW